MEDETRNIQDNPDIRLAFRGKLAKSRRLFRRIQSVNPFAYRGGATWLLLGKWGIKMEKKNEVKRAELRFWYKVLLGKIPTGNHGLSPQKVFSVHENPSKELENISHFLETQWVGNQETKGFEHWVGEVTWTAVKINSLRLVQKYKLSVLGGSYCLTVFCSNQH